MNKLAPVKREDMLAAADQLERMDKVNRTDYFLWLTERGKEYPFKQLVRLAYEVATKTKIDTTFFQSKSTTRNYISKKFGYPISFRMEGCREYSIPDPIIAEEQDGICVTFQKDIYTEEYLRGLDLNERQVKAVLYVKQNHSITNAEYQKLNNLGKSVSTTELQDLIDKKMVEKMGTTGVAQSMSSRI